MPSSSSNLFQPPPLDHAAYLQDTAALASRVILRATPSLSAPNAESVMAEMARSALNRAKDLRQDVGEGLNSFVFLGGYFICAPTYVGVMGCVLKKRLAWALFYYSTIVHNRAEFELTLPMSLLQSSKRAKVRKKKAVADFIKTMHQTGGIPSLDYRSWLL